DFSPRGVAAREELVVTTLRDIDQAEVTGDAERRAATCLREELTHQHDSDLLGTAYRDLRSWLPPVCRMCEAFDLMPVSSAEDWPAVVERMAAVPAAVAGIEATLREGLARQLP